MTHEQAMALLHSLLAERYVACNDDGELANQDNAAFLRAIVVARPHLRRPLSMYSVGWGLAWPLAENRRANQEREARNAIGKFLGAWGSALEADPKEASDE